MANILEIIVNGTDKTSKVFGQISGNLDQMGKKMQVTGGIIMGVGAGIVGGMLKMADSYTKAGKAILDMSQRTGVGVKALSELKYMADLNGTSLEAMEMSIRMMQKSVTNAFDEITGATKDATKAQEDYTEASKQLVTQKIREAEKLAELVKQELADSQKSNQERVQDAQIWLQRELADNKTSAAERLQAVTEIDEQAAKEILSIQEDLNNKNRQTQIEYNRKIEDLTRSAARDLEKINLEKTRKLADLEDEYQQKLSELQITIKANSNAARAAFDKLGISLDDLKGKKPEEQFWALAEAVAEVEDPTERAALAMDIFGRSGTHLLPILAEGSAGIARYKKEAQDMNVVFDEESAAAAAKFQNALSTIKTALMGLGAEILSDITPKLTELMEKFTAIIGKVMAWTEANPKLADTIFKVGLALIGLGGAIAVLGTIARSIVAINTAIIVMRSLSGVGALTILASLGVAAAGIAAMYGLDKLANPTPPPGVSHFASGGIVTSPTLGLVGEAGPEAIIPLNRMDRPVEVKLYLDGEQIADVIQGRLDRFNRIQQPVGA